MKKLLLISVGLIMACLTQAQPVSDNATIPIGVTLNSILRLTVVSGGNIEFVVRRDADGETKRLAAICIPDGIPRVDQIAHH